MMFVDVILISYTESNAKKALAPFVAVISVHFSGKRVKPTGFKAFCRFVIPENVQDDSGKLPHRVGVLVPEVEISFCFGCIAFEENCPAISVRLKFVCLRAARTTADGFVDENLTELKPVIF